ncbi:cytochrome P450 2J4-like [Sceloporus undulatus]|uniref:cytochrome P450 2J4-like n=1 Tax=Sceloporus undulatus TaxID=8520 RepID=UPI001C4CC0EE|nr:cytochrome P450 2J4-like [Sceloporus undulatus]
MALIPRLILQYLKQLWSHRRYPPGPFPLPAIGGLWRLGVRLSPDTFTKMMKHYGNIYTIWIGHIPMVVLSGYQAVKEGLVDHSEDLADRPLTPFLEASLKGRGIMFSNGHTWKQQRRFGQVTMRKLGLGKKGMEHQIEEEAQQLVETFARAKGQPLDPSAAITKAVSNVICALAFGSQFSTEDENMQKLLETLDFGLKFGGSFFHALYELFPWIMKHLPGPHKAALSALDMVVSLVKKEVKKHKKQQSLHEPQDFIDFYLLQMEKSSNDLHTTYDEENLAECIIEFFGAGTETTATTLRWALLLMAAHPDIQGKIQKEMEDVFGASCSICYQDRKKLPYTNAAIHEIQRSRYVFLSGVPRQNVKDVTICGLLIPKGTFIMPDLRSVLLDPEQWETPEKFNPHHFLDKDGNFLAREEFLAFGEGSRVCLGEQLARIEIFLFFTSLLRSFSFQLPPGVGKINTKPAVGLTMHPHPYKLCAVPRCNAP